MDSTFRPDRLVGRERELGVLADALARDRPIVVLGELGIGRTSLVREAVAASGRRTWEGGAFATLSWVPYLPLRRALRRRLDASPWGDPAFVADVTEREVGPDVLVLDDLHWADRGTLDVAALLAPRIAVVASVRAGTEGTAAALEALVAAGFDRLDLGPLPPAAAEEVARRSGAGGGGRARGIAARAGGNPFLITLLAEAGAGPASAEHQMTTRLRGLPAASREAVGLLALVGRPVPAGWLDGQAPALWADCLAVGGDEAVSIRHDLLATAIIAEMAPSERVAIHRRLAGLVGDPAEAARHHLAAGDVDLGYAAAMLAAERADSPGERAAHLGIAAACASGPDADGLRIRAAAQLRVAGALGEAATLLDAVTTNDPVTLAGRDLVRARLAWSAGDPEGMRAAIDGGLARPGLTGTEAEIGLRTERVVIRGLVDGAFHDGIAEAESVITAAAAVGLPDARARLLRATLMAASGEGDWAPALEAVVTAARDQGDIETELSAANNLVTGHEMHGHPEDGRRVAQAMLLRTRTLKMGAWERQFAALLVNLDLHAGRLASVISDGEALLDAGLDPLASQQVGLAVALAEVDLGHHDVALRRSSDLLDAASPDFNGRGNALYVLAEAELWGGRPDHAQRHLKTYRQFADVEYGLHRLADVTAGWAALDAGVALPARIAHGEAVGMLFAAERERDALEALASGDAESAVHAFDQAAREYAAYHRRGAVRAAWGAADAVRRSGDAEAALARALAAEREAGAMGIVPILGRIHRLLRLMGLRRTARSARRSTGRGLSPREREIVSLVAAGLSNAEIARRLGVGRPTVARLLGSAMTKLGVDSRAAVAATAAADVVA